MLKHIFQTDEAGSKKPVKKQSAYDAMKERRSNAWKEQPTTDEPQLEQKQQGGQSALDKVKRDRASAWRGNNG